METTNHRNVPAGEVCEVKAVDGIVIEMFRSGKYTGDRDGTNGFRPAKVLKWGELAWSYQTAGTKPGQFADLIEFGDEFVITIQNNDVVFTVLRVNDFAHSVTAKFAGKVITVGGSSLEDLLDIKIAVAAGLALDYWYSPEEGEILRKRSQAAREAAKAKQSELENANDETRLRRAQFMEGVLARKTVEAWSEEGKHFFGIPVTTDAEWLCLPNGKYVIMTNADGKPVEAFIVGKQNSKVKKVNATPVSESTPKQKESTHDIPEALDQRNVTLRNETRQILVFEDTSAIKQLQTAGLNSGTWVGVLPKGSEILTVYAVTKGGYNTVGQLKKKSSSQQAT